MGERTGHDSVVVLSYGYWQQRFGQDPNAIGQTIRIDGIFRQIYSRLGSPHAGQPESTQWRP